MRKLEEDDKKMIDYWLLNPEVSKSDCYRKFYPDSKSTNPSVGFNRVFQKEQVQEYIRVRQIVQDEQAMVNEQHILTELAHSAFLDPAQLFDENGNLLPIQDMPETARRALAALDVEVTVVGRGDDAEPVTTKKIKLNPKLKALELLGQTLAMFKQSIDLNAGVSDDFEERIREAKEAARELRDAKGESDG